MIVLAGIKWYIDILTMLKHFESADRVLLLLLLGSGNQIESGPKICDDGATNKIW